MDIDDILSSVTRAHYEAHGGLVVDATQSRQDLELLTQAWVAERVAPELLPYPAELMKRIMARLRSQIELIEDTTSSMDAGTSFALVVLQTELERYKFLVRSFLRTRAAKIDLHPLHLLELHRQQPSSSAFDPGNPLMSASEAQYAQLHADLLEKHYHASFLASFPPKLSRLDDRAGAGGAAMVEGPDVDKVVFVRCLGRKKDRDTTRLNYPNGLDLGEDSDYDHDHSGENELYEPIEISCAFVQAPPKNTQSTQRVQDTSTRSSERRVRMVRGQIWVLRWSSIKNAIANGECELL